MHAVPEFRGGTDEATACNCQNEYYAPENAFFVEERAGHWGHLRRVPGLRALKHGASSINSVACPSAGNCAVGGAYHDRSRKQAFVAVERNGRWGQAIKVRGLAALHKGANAHGVVRLGG